MKSINIVTAIALLKTAGFTVLGTMVGMASAYANISQSPLLLGGGSVPGNLVLTPSVEYPTVISAANLGDYNKDSTYAGYFDSNKCYDYIREDFTHSKFGKVKGSEGGGYFTPVNFDFKEKKNCGGRWSGHYLNWAATQTIDPFRKALTGGYRVVDTQSQTILEKATRANRGADARNISDKNIAKTISPYENTIINSLLSSGNDYQKNKTLRTERTEKDKDNNDKTITEYFSVRVEVCKSGLLEENCKQYGSNYKPEGLLQEYSDDIRYSVFSYLNIDGNDVNGGVLRAPQDYIGLKMRERGVAGTQDNLYKEWDPNTGVLYKNPRSAAEGNSGTINYINKFGEISNQHKSNDPVSELYYAAIRYLRGKGNLSSYTNQANTDLKKDYFPVITSWNPDPVQYSCQKNAILGIGDVNTHEDRNLLPGDGDDNSFVDLNSYTKKVFDLEGINKAGGDEFTGRGNSAYIAGLAYYANTQDIRPDLAGKQTVSTYWVDVRENQVLLDRKRNQYWLAAKYGGFEVPANYAFGTRLEDAWWNKSGERLPITNDPRPDSFYEASDAENMVKSLRQAFAQIASEVQSTTTALASNSTRLKTGAAVFQSRLNNKLWSGDLLALAISPEGVVSDTPSWSAAAKLNALTSSQITSRNILSVESSATTGNITTPGIEFKWSDLSDEQKVQLISEDHLNYLRGDRSNERGINKPDGKFRERGGRLGDIVNSDPQFVYQQDYGYTRLKSWENDVAGKYKAFRESADYKNRVPMVVVGANDGMLHGFNASLANGGDELFAFVPNGVFHNLSKLTDYDYTHRYYVDGATRVADAWLGSKWATVAVGSTGAGGKSIFALDLTNVKTGSNVTKTNVMWEFTDPAMGYTMGQPAVIALPNGKFGVVVSSGYHNEAPEKGYVWVLDVANGSVIKKFELNTAGNLGAIFAADLSSNMVADRLYVADTLGNIWRIDLTGAVSEWGIPGSLSAGPLFKVKNKEGEAQAITAPLEAALNDKGEPMLVFGTGSFYRLGDNEVSDTQRVDTLYGLFDTGTLIDGRSELLKQSISAEVKKNGQTLRAISNNELTDQKGWYLDLVWYPADDASLEGGPKGERVVAQASLRSGRATFTSMTPDADPCASGGTSMIMTLNLLSGGRLAYAYYDANDDGKIDDDDYVEVNGERIPPSGTSDPSEGVIKGVDQKYKVICYAGSTGAVKCKPVAGSTREGRQTWREVRSADE